MKDKDRIELAYRLRLFALNVMQIATELERPIRERPFEPVKEKKAA